MDWILRHQIELQLKEEAKAIEIIKKDIEIQLKKCRVVENNLQKSQEELEQFQVLMKNHMI